MNPTPLPSIKIHLFDMNQMKSGVYFLIENDRINYVGQAMKVCNRINGHISTNEIPFDTAIWFEVLINDLSNIEYFWISILRPPYNFNGKLKRINELEIKLQEILSDQEINKIKEIEQQTFALISNFLKREISKCEKACSPTFIAEISMMRQQMFDWLIAGDLFPSMAHKIVTRFFGWSIHETSIDKRPTKWHHYFLPPEYGNKGISN